MRVLCEILQRHPDWDVEAKFVRGSLSIVVWMYDIKNNLGQTMHIGCRELLTAKFDLFEEVVLQMEQRFLATPTEPEEPNHV